jgi:CheY-like chemotaxis protein/anti-sigma regulatory factor (Ser/Thr protein kinase)
MSHELRTPLNAVLGFAQILELDDLTSEQRESAEQIIKAGRHLLELINEVLDIARIETGQLALSIEPVPVREVLTEALDLVRPLATCSDIRLVDDASRLARSAFADRQRLRQVLINLLSNAVKYNRPGGRVIATWEEPVGDGIRITISDTGTGIDPEKMDRLFSPFDRLGAEESGIEGVGLGLALSRRLMEAMGGTLEAQSRVGEGSRFTVTLRLADAGISESPSGYWMSSPQIESLRTSGTVLCIEDNASNMRLVERALQTRPGVVLLSASTGQVGLELARERHPDLVLLDMQLPDVAGEEVLRLLQSHPDTQEIPVLVLSADATSIRIEQAVAAGAVGYLTKPLDLQLFLSKIDGFLSGGRAS